MDPPYHGAAIRFLIIRIAASNICPLISHVLVGDSGGLEACWVIIFSYEDDGVYYREFGYKLAWDFRGEEYYEYTKRKISAKPNMGSMKYGGSLKSLEYITDEEFK